MARLVEEGRRSEGFAVPATCLIGRSPRCDLRIDAPDVAPEHARVAWTSRGWSLQDLGSGTWLDGRLQPPGERARLEIGSTVQCGERCFRVACDAPPVALARRIADGRTIEACAERLALSPEVLVQRVGEEWRLERDGVTGEAEDLMEIEVAGERWRLHLPGVEVWPGAEVAPPPPRLAELRLDFRVSRDEEHVALTAVGRGWRRELGARSHNYLLLTLARLREEERELEPAERGWVHTDRLTRMLRADENRINVDVHRLRKQLQRTGVAGATGLIERRRYRKQLRLGPPRVRIMRA